MEKIWDLLHYVTDPLYLKLGSSLLIVAMLFRLIVTEVLYYSHEAKHVRRVRRPPGSWLLAAVDLICSKATAESFNQAVADMRTEYFDALRVKRPYKAMWILFRSYIAITRAFVVTKPLAAAVEFVVGIVLKAGK